MTETRIGVIGLGNIGKHHAGYLAAGKVKNARLAAVCTSFPGKAAPFSSSRAFNDPLEMMRSGCIDAVLIATPHHQHVTLGISAFQHGLHVLVEKPIAAHKADAERLIAASGSRPDLVFSAMFQFRIEPRYETMRRIINEDGIGRLLRVTWIMTDWYRTEAYYLSGGWRATWRGEGGGVLINQCLHNLDALQWMTGMPSRIRGFCRLGRHHAIEVEDEATACFEYPSGAVGTLITSTAELPGSNRLEIAGTKGRLLLENDLLEITRNEEDSAEFSKRADSGFGRPKSSREEMPVPAAKDSHAKLTQNFVNAIQGREPLIAPGAEGIHSVELANAILYSSLKERTVELPLDSAAYEVELQRLIATSTAKKKTVKVSNEDITSSFRR